MFGLNKTASRRFIKYIRTGFNNRSLSKDQARRLLQFQENSRIYSHGGGMQLLPKTYQMGIKLGTKARSFFNRKNEDGSVKYNFVPKKQFPQKRVLFNIPPKYVNYLPQRRRSSEIADKRGFPHAMDDTNDPIKYSIFSNLVVKGKSKVGAEPKSESKFSFTNDKASFQKKPQEVGYSGKDLNTISRQLFPNFPEGAQIFFSGIPKVAEKYARPKNTQLLFNKNNNNKTQSSPALIVFDVPKLPKWNNEPILYTPHWSSTDHKYRQTRLNNMLIRQSKMPKPVRWVRNLLRPIGQQPQYEAVTYPRPGHNLFKAIKDIWIPQPNGVLRKLDSPRNAFYPSKSFDMFNELY